MTVNCVEEEEAEDMLGSVSISIWSEDCSLEEDCIEVEGMFVAKQMEVSKGLGRLWGDGRGVLEGGGGEELGLVEGRDWVVDWACRA